MGGSLLASLRREYPADRLRAAFRAAGVERSAVVAFVSPDPMGGAVPVFLITPRELVLLKKWHAPR